MKILLISPRPPYPTFGGLELRVYRLFKALGRYHQISLVCTSTEEVDADSLRKLHEVFETVSMSPVTLRPAVPAQRRSLSKRFSDLWSPPVDYFDITSGSQEMLPVIRDMLKNSRFDIVHLMGIRMMKYVPDISRHASVCDCVDDYALYCYRTIRHQKGIINKARWFFDCLTAVSYEKKFAGMFDEITLVSPVDAAVMRRICPAARISIVPIGVDSDHFKPSTTDISEPILMFSGVMDYEPNVTAVDYFCSSIFPRIRKEIPDARFLIVGRDPTPEVRHFEESMPGVTVTGFVDDIREYFDKSLIYVAPIKSGAGIKIKILEAWAMEKPVVATSMSCDGIDVAPGQDVLVADSSVEFAKSVIDLLGDENLRRKLTTNARKKVVDKYSWESQAEKFNRIYERVVRKKESRDRMAGSRSPNSE
jgi:glycosyltransferase involved in cell wall biosynthesis